MPEQLAYGSSVFLRAPVRATNSQAKAKTDYSTHCQLTHKVIPFPPNDLYFALGFTQTDQDAKNVGAKNPC